MNKYLRGDTKIIDSYLENEQFTANRIELNDSNIENMINLISGVGFDKNDDDVFALKVNTKICQKLENQDIEISKLNFTYVFIFKSDESIVKDIKEYNKSKEKMTSFTNNMVSIVYPYIKEHIESIYNKANLPINVPLNTEE